MIVTLYTDPSWEIFGQNVWPLLKIMPYDHTIGQKDENNTFTYMHLRIDIYKFILSIAKRSKLTVLTFLARWS